MKPLLCSFGLPPTHFIRYPYGGAQKHLRTVVLRQPSSLFLHLPRGPQFSHPSLRSGQTFGSPSSHCGAQKHLRTVVLRHPSPPLIRRAIQISRFLASVVGGFLGDRVELHRLAVERFPLAAGAAPRFGGNIRSEGKLTL